MRLKSLLSLLSVWFLSSCTGSQTQVQMQWAPYTKGGSSLSVLVPHGGQSYEVLLASRVDTRADSLLVPAIVSAYDYKNLMVLRDTIRFDLGKGTRANVMQQEVLARLTKPFAPRASGIYRFSLSALYEDRLEGLESWGIALRPILTEHSANTRQ